MFALHIPGNIARVLIIGLLTLAANAAEENKSTKSWEIIKGFFAPPTEYEGKLANYRSPLLFLDGSKVRNAEDWQRRRQEILAQWHGLMGAWPPLLQRPKVEILSSNRRENFTEHKVRVEISKGQDEIGYLLIPQGQGPFPAVVVPFYEPETSIGRKGVLRDFGYQLAKRGFVTLNIGSPGGNARDPVTGEAVCQPLSFLGYVAANCHTILAQRKDVDPKRIGIVGHSYGGKWALFASCLYEEFAAAAWSDPGIVFDESRGNVNYWEPWYLGLDNKTSRKPGVPNAQNPRTGAYKEMVAQGRDLHELHALMAPRPFLVSGGSEDPAERWIPLNHSVAVNQLLGATNRVAMTNRPAHDPTEESNNQLYAFFEYFLGK